MSSIDIDTKTSYPQGHTLRHRYNHYYPNKDYSALECSRSRVVDGVIPITEVDSLFSVRDIYTMAEPYYYYRGGSFNLEKRELFNDFIDACEEFATEKKVVYDFKTGLNKCEYVVPIVDHLNPSKIPHSEDIYEPKPCLKKEVSKPQIQQPKKSKKRSWRYYEMKKQAQTNPFFVVINGNRYNSDYIYKRTATGFVPITMHPHQEVKHDEGDTIMRSKITYSKTSVTLTFPKDSTLISIVLRPEPMKFEYVYDTRDRGTRYNRYHISVLENDPNYIKKFELYYRSSITDGQWVKYGIFDGNSSIFDSTKIKFDGIVAKEIRLVPISHTGSFEKVSVIALKHMEKRCDKVESDSVTYTFNVPHGKFRHTYSREMDNISGGCQNVCGCYKCTGKKDKGGMKSCHREFMDMCSDF